MFLKNQKIFFMVEKIACGAMWMKWEFLTFDFLHILFESLL